MIKPAQLSITLHPGALFSRTLRLQTSTGAALDVSGYAPFKMQIRTAAQGALMATVTVDNSAAAQGLLTLTLAAAASIALPEVTAAHDLIDKDGNPWIYGPAVIRRTITQPPAAP
jgi:hypothetical protein